jgi:D-3-phosphoglycerate dehydrogenase
MFDICIFEQFRKDSYFINTARGELVDSDALLSALEQGWIAGAALDVVDGEFVPGFETRARHHPLIQYAANNTNLIITPHIAGSTRDAWLLTQRRTIEKLLQGLDDGTIATSKIA